ncbi:unnamed protein product [Schistosoma curassoni]|uniref:Uncharacterized protein n=1 Tax=Schistosoma curassoni TaxID=6186 RepID=A0A183JNC3_9TREM|nr:unnamed protein product [Schistosoma curassoni]
MHSTNTMLNLISCFSKHINSPEYFLSGFKDVCSS